MSSPTPKNSAGRINPKKHKGKFAREARLPDDFPGIRDEPIVTSTAKASRVLDLFERSGTLAELEERCGDHPGVQTDLPLKALLVAAEINAQENSNFIRSDITAVLAGFRKKTQAKLGLLCDNPEDAVPISYNVVVDQLNRLEDILEEGWKPTRTRLVPGIPHPRPTARQTDARPSGQHENHPCQAPTPKNRAKDPLHMRPNPSRKAKGS